MTATGPDPDGDYADTVLVDAVRHEAGPVVAALHRLTGDFDVAEEAVQDALVSAVAAWRRDGPRPTRAWLTLTARRKAVDRLRREAARGRLAAAVAAARVEEAGPPERATAWSDTDERVAMPSAAATRHWPSRSGSLTLRSVAGLTTEQVARAFLVPEATLAQRIVRAKRKIVATGIRMEVLESRMPERLDDVLTVVYLTYNAGFVDVDSRGLAEDAVWLAEVLTTGLPSEPEAWGLLALLTLQQSRAAARFGPEGSWCSSPTRTASGGTTRPSPGPSGTSSAQRCGDGPEVPAPGGDRRVPCQRPHLRRDRLAADPHALRFAAAPRPVAHRPAQPGGRPGRAPDPLRPSRRSRRWATPSTHTTSGTRPGRICCDEWVGSTPPPRRTGGRSTSPPSRPNRLSSGSGWRPRNAARGALHGLAHVTVTDRLVPDDRDQ